MKKIHLYFMPGLGANPKIFEHISLPKDQFEIHLLEWKIPISEVESIQDYAKRMTYEIKHQNPVLLGVSFGGVLVQEIAKIIDVEKIILVSSIKSHHEFPYRLKLLQKTKAYKFFPTKIIENRVWDHPGGSRGRLGDQFGPRAAQGSKRAPNNSEKLVRF